MSLIKPETLKGFRDYPPELMMPREKLIDTAKRIYRSYGFAPIDTPALEKSEILAGQGSDETDKQMFRFTDAGGRDVGMRFDLTVPLARFAAQHIGQLGTPFKRYHIATVWRGEKPQRGRYREFMQCDFDTIGTTSIVSDIETALVIFDLMNAIGFDEFTIRVNNRKVLNGLLQKSGLEDRATEVLRAIDKLDKIGPEKVTAEMKVTASASDEQAASILRLSQLNGTNDEILSAVGQMVAGNETGELGVENLRQLVDGVRAVGVDEKNLKLDIGIARGLDYYTGTVFETELGQLPGIGSVCSGGRYDNLASKFTKLELPGIGASLGLDRLLAAQEELGLIEKVRTPAPVFIVYFEKDRLADYLQIAAALRGAGIGAVMYPENKKFDKQLKYADKQGFQVAIIAGSQDFAEQKCQVKNLAQRSQVEVSIADGFESLINQVGEALSH
ncbi:histidine--tRNA ligase [Pirellulaceae bacterium]|jgi:histidyl-tRNA synthetase|nr:histidine--tRNA ligase [Pirellulaceae bacterium]